MEMSNSEIVVSYKQAKHKAEQIGILAQLNRCSNAKIVEILIDGGIKPTAFRRNKSKIEKQDSEQNQPVRIEDLEPIHEAITVEKAIAALYDKARELRQRKQTIEDELAEISVHINRIDDYIAGRGDGNE